MYVRLVHNTAQGRWRGGSYEGQGGGKEAVVREYRMPCNCPHMVWDRGERRRRSERIGLASDAKQATREREMKSFEPRVLGQVKNDWKKQRNGRNEVRK